MIKHTADLLSSCVDPSVRRERFLGHVGGDDFVAVVDPADAESVATMIVERFDGSILQFYDEEDRARGHIETVDRRGILTQFPIMGIAIAVVSNLNRSFQHPGEVALVASELKKLAKSKDNKRVRL